MQSDEDHSSEFTGLRACLLVTGDTIARWQAVALQDAIQRGLTIACVFKCDTKSPTTGLLKHAGYYAIRAVSMRTSWSKRIEWRSLVDQGTPVREFDATPDGAWQRVPPDVRHDMSGFDLDVVIKYGMGLLRDPDDLPARFGVLSFHHGDPASYRGRPAGFYEVVDDTGHIGTIVQRIGNTLDAGAVLAYASSRVVRHSYRQTLEDAYGNSTHLLVKALRNARAGVSLDHRTDGPNYRRPDNRTAARFLCLVLQRRLRRIAYGAFVEKSWSVGHSGRLDLHPGTERVTLATPNDLPIPRGFTFLADPMPGRDGGVWCEAMDARSGRGRILALQDGAPPAPIDLPGLEDAHCSYPFHVEDSGRHYVLPEMAAAGSPRLFELDELNRVVASIPLEGLEGTPLLDPTLLAHADRWWLFAGRPGSAASLLWLWSAGSLTGPYEAHPQNPIVMDVARARPAGPIIDQDGQLFRPGQDSRGGYGDGLTISEITTLSAAVYEEVARFEVKVAGRRGPHTILVGDQATIIDSYRDQADLFAWLRRLKRRLRRS